MQVGEGRTRKRSRSASFVIPVLHEEGSLAPLHAALTIVVDSLEAETNIIFVDDGSSDRSDLVATLDADLLEAERQSDRCDR
jgi:glycosyltransferase involved in cell wall biosynthesis